MAPPGHAQLGCARLRRDGVPAGAPVTSRLAGALLVAGLATASVKAQAQAGSRGTGHESATQQVVSPSVVASLVSIDGTLELVVLWRGTPGWFANGNQRSGGGGGNYDQLYVQADFGPTHLELTLDRRSRRVTAYGRSLSLPNNQNVVFVDHVDSKSPAVSLAGSQLEVIPADTPTFAMAFARAPAVVAFLRCDVPAPSVQLTQRARSFACDDLTSQR